MRGLLIAAPASGQGKTMLTLGLLRALSRRGIAVASAKSGPDYIDPAFHAAATGRPCVTLDAWAAGPAQLRARAAAQPAGLLVVEGAMGLYDGAAVGTGAGMATADRRNRPSDEEGSDRLGGRVGEVGRTVASQASAPRVLPVASPERPPGGRDRERHAFERAVERALPGVVAGRGWEAGAPVRFHSAGQDAPFGDSAHTAPAAAAPGSAAALALALGVPVLLVLDIARMGQGAAAIVHGLATFPGAPPVAGVVLNRAGSDRHAAMARGAVAAIRPVLGTIPRRDDLAVPSRHLGLVQAGEMADLDNFLDRAADLVEACCDIDAILAAAAPVAPAAGPPARLPPLGQRIAVARDAAFSFAYWHMLEDWRAAGVEILPFAPLDDQPPDADADAVFLPGGYPELHPGRIAAAGRFRAGMLAAAASGATVYGECGGFMVLGDGLVDGAGKRHAMLGLLRLETSFERPARVLGYRRLAPLAGPWAGPLAAHEFHAAATLRQDGAPLFAMTDAAGADLGTSGLVAGRVAGSWAHVIEPAGD